MATKIIPLTASQWKMYNQYGPKLRQKEGDGSLVFDFPPVDGDLPDYIYRPFPPAITSLKGKTLIVSLRVTAGKGVKFLFPTDGNPGTAPPSARLYWTTAINSFAEFAHWYSNPAKWELQPGTATLTVPFEPDLWSSLYGRFGSTKLPKWKEAINSPSAFAVCVGGGSFAAHGVGANGPATLGITGCRLEW